MTFSMSAMDKSARLALEAEDEENAMSAKELEEAKKREKEEQAKKVGDSLGRINFSIQWNTYLFVENFV